MRKNDIVELEISSVSNLGCGVGRIPDTDADGGMVVFVPGAVSGDRVRAKIIKVTKSYCAARLEEVLKPSAEREDTSFCPAPASCGGCAYRFLKYESELELKRETVRSEFRKAGLDGVEVSPVLYAADADGVPKTRGCRNKAQYRFVSTKSGIRAGFYASGTHRVAGYEDCSLHPAVFRDIAVWFCRCADRYGLSVYSEETGRGLLRHLYLRRGEGSGELEVTVVINGDELPHGSEIARELAGAFPEVSGVLININRGNTNVITGREYRTLYGKPYLTDIFCGMELEISPAAFYQVNHDAAELLCRTAAGLLGDSAEDLRLLDLYCGIGTIGLSMSGLCRELCGVEIVPEAVECARRNAARNGIGNAKFVCADSAAGAEELLFAAGFKPDVVVLDPPRKGCSPELIDALFRAGIEKIIYISCNPATLARDVSRLCALGYTPGSVTPVDLFPRTGHVETVCLLESAKNLPHISFTVNMEDLPRPTRKSATYDEIKAYVSEKHGLKVSSLYIAQIKEKHGLKERENYNIGNGKSKELVCPPEKEQAILDAFKHFGMIK